MRAEARPSLGRPAWGPRLTADSTTANVVFSASIAMYFFDRERCVGSATPTASIPAA